MRQAAAKTVDMNGQIEIRQGGSMSPAGRSQDGKPATSDSARPGDDVRANPGVTHDHNGSAAAAEAKTATAVATADTDAETQEQTAAPQAPVAPDETAPDKSGKRRKAKSGESKRRGPVRQVFGAIGRFFARISAPNWVRHVTLLVRYSAAGIGATWPRFNYLTGGKVPRTTDEASF